MRRTAAVFALIAAFFVAAPAWAQTPGLYDRPILVLDPGVHTAPIRRADVDAAGEIAVTGSHDKTVRLWSVKDGRLLRTIRLPVGPGNVGKVFTVAISPDGETVAAGGWTRWNEADRQDQIYLFDAASGAMSGRIEGLPSVVLHLAFSPDGRWLAATLGGANGLRVFDRAVGWAEAFRDEDYDGRSHGADFAADGRLATTSFDGRLRLYDADGALSAVVETGFARPFGVAFSPDGRRIVVGFDDTSELRLYDGRTLAALPAPDAGGIGNGDLSEVAWSADGATLFAGGRYGEDGTFPVIAWARSGLGARQALPAGLNTVMSLRPLPGGDLFVAAADPWLGRLRADGRPRWPSRAPLQMNPRGQRHTLRVSFDGLSVAFSFAARGKDPARFDLDMLTLTTVGTPEVGLAAPEQNALPVTDWDYTTFPKLNGFRLPLQPHETSFSLAIHPDGKRFVLGTHWHLRAFDDSGKELWRRTAAGAWAVNISGDGRYAVAANADGTIRWHAMEDGRELLAFFPFNDKRNWVVWEPDGRFAATLGARSALRWQVNKGWDTTPVTVPASAIPNSHRPEVIKRVLPLGGTMQAAYAVEESKRRAAIKRLTGSIFAPGAQLHSLAIGVSTYRSGAPAKNLQWADEDARDLHAALAAQSEDLWPYQKGYNVMLRDAEATGQTILNQLEAIGRKMAAAPGQSDFAVVHFSGHGAVVGEGPAREFYLLPHDADLRSVSRIRRTGLSGTELRQQVAAMAEHGRVLLLLDACRSGALDAGLLRRTLAGRNVTVLTSSSSDEDSWERDEWRNGAFTEVLLEGLGRAGDTDSNGMISVEELVGYVSRQVRGLTGGKQNPAVEMRFSGELFASRF